MLAYVDHATHEAADTFNVKTGLPSPDKSAYRKLATCSSHP
jgi:hypothetical protein